MKRLLLVVIVLLVALVVVGRLMKSHVVPDLRNARQSGNEASAIGALRAIISAQQVYTTSCVLGGFAVTLNDLAKPPSGGATTFISEDLGVNGVVKMGYRITVARDAASGVKDVGTAAATCNGSTSTPASSYFASAEPVAPGDTGIRYFATDARGTIYESTHPIASPIVPSATVTEIK